MARRQRRVLSAAGSSAQFIDDTFTGLDLGPDFLPSMRSAMMPDLPDEPTQDQVSAWVELAGLVQGPHFRASLRQAAAAHARAREGNPGRPQPGS